MKSHGLKRKLSKCTWKKMNQIKLCGLAAERPKKKLIRGQDLLSNKTMLRKTRQRIYP
jgi:hypothetical protein